MTVRVDVIIESALKCGELVVDVEHNPDIPLVSEDFDISGCSFSTGDHTTYLESREQCMEILNACWELTIIGHNVKYDIRCLVAAGWVTDYPPDIVCTLIGVNLIDDNRRPNELSLESIVYDYFGYVIKKFKDVWGTEFFASYSCDDARYEWKVWQKIKPQLEEQKLMKIFRKVLMPATKVFADMEAWLLAHI